MPIQKIIAFDIGFKRIGVAVSDPFGEYAIPSNTYFCTKDKAADAKALAQIAKTAGASVIVCGMPVNFDGTPSVQTERTAAFIELLKAQTDLPIELEDERFTTMEARQTQIQGGVKREKRKETIDSIAASYILDGYLSKLKKRKQQKGATDMKDMRDEEYEEEEHIIELTDDEGNTEKYLHVGTIDYKGAWYCFFQKAEPETEEEEDEVVMFLLKGEGDDQELVPLEDEQLMDEVFAEFCAKYEEYENSDDARRLDE